MPKPTPEVPSSALDAIFQNMNSRFYAPRSDSLFQEARQLLRKAGQVTDRLEAMEIADQGRARLDESEDAESHSQAFLDEGRQLQERLREIGAPIPTVEEYQQMVAPTRPISELTAQNLADLLPASVLQAALELQRIRAGGEQSGRIDGIPEGAARLPIVLVNSVNRLVAGTKGIVQLPEHNFAVLQALSGTSQVDLTTLGEIGERFGFRDEAFGRRAVFEVRQVIDNPDEESSLITTKKSSKTEPASYTGNYTLGEVNLRMPQPRRAVVKVPGRPAGQRAQRVERDRVIQLTDREQQILDAVLVAQASGGATKEDLLKIQGLTSKNLLWIKSNLSAKLVDLGQGRIINIGSNSEPRYIQASVSIESDPVHTPAVTEVVPHAPRLTAEALDARPETAEPGKAVVFNYNEVGYLARMITKHPAYAERQIADNEEDRTLLEDTGKLGKDDAVNVDDLIAKVISYSEDANLFESLPKGVSAIVAIVYSLTLENTQVV